MLTMGIIHLTEYDCKSVPDDIGQGRIAVSPIIAVKVV